ncbi:MAG: hypothetical protein RL244_1307 [Pseudomonadota bacterium]|jgi:HK97 family phage portal protein
MSITTRIKSLIGLERREINPNDTWAAFTALRTGTVTVESAQSIAAVYAAVGVISEALGSLPLRLYKRDDESRSPASDHPLHKVLHQAPNAHQSPQEFFEWMTSAMLLHGNAFARVSRGWDGQVRELFPLPSDRVVIKRRGDCVFRRT